MARKEFEPGEEVFNQMTRFVEVFVISPLVFTVGFGGNHRNLTRLLQGNEDPLIGIEALVGEQNVGFELRQQGISPLQIARLSSGEMESSGVAESIDGRGSWCSARPCCVRWLAPSPFFARPSTVLMCAHDSRIDHRVFVVRIPRQVLEQLLPHAATGPAAEPRVNDPEDHAMESRLGSDTAPLLQTTGCPLPVDHRSPPARQHPFDPLPLIVP
jgi:hypothetical protein